MYICLLRNGSLWLGAILTALVLSGSFLQAGQGTEMEFDVLQIGTETLSNVTVTTTNSEYVFLLHSKGMGNYKVANLSPEVLMKLGYPPPKSAQTNAVTAWAKEQVTQLNAENIQQVEETLLTKVPAALPELINQNRGTVAAAVGIALFVHLFFSFCCMVICHKTGTEAGLLVWVPIFQLLPLLRAANMSPVWAIAFLIPVLNIVAQIIWSFKISKARGFGAALGILLLIPVLNLFAFLYLTFSAAAPVIETPSTKRRTTDLMTLETA